MEVSNGVLRLTADNTTIHASDGDSYEYVSDMVSTGRDSYLTNGPPRFEFTYGFAEARVRIPAGTALWPAFWMLPSTHESRPEIDVMEVIGQAPNVFEANVHYLDASGSEHDPGRAWSGPDFSAGWHTFAVDWRPGELAWHVDGIERWRFEDSDAVFAEPMYLLLNLAVGGNWPGAPDSSTEFPATYAIDYVRVWQER